VGAFVHLILAATQVRVSEALEQHLEQGIRSRGWRFYYEAISDFLAHDAEGRELAALLLPLYMGLWDLDCVRATFTLTMHRFIFGTPRLHQIS